MLGEPLDNVGQHRPLTHNINSYVTVSDCANILPRGLDGNSSYHNYIIDAVRHLDGGMSEQRANCKIL